MSLQQNGHVLNIFLEEKDFEIHRSLGKGFLSDHRWLKASCISENPTTAWMANHKSWLFGESWTPSNHHFEEGPCKPCKFQELCDHYRFHLLLNSSPSPLLSKGVASMLAGLFIMYICLHPKSSWASILPLMSCFTINSQSLLSLLSETAFLLLLHCAALTPNYFRIEW